MRERRPPFREALLAFALLTPVTAAAQTCRGTTSLRDFFAHVDAGIALLENAKTFGAGVTFGSTVFLSGSASYTAHDYNDLNVTTVAGSVGLEVSPEESRLSICPSAGMGVQFGLEAAGVDYTTVAVWPGLAVGYRIDIEPGLWVVPSAEAAFVYERVTADSGSGLETTTDTYGSVNLSFAFVFSRRVALVPNVQIPVAADGAASVLGVGLALGVGGID